MNTELAMTISTVALAIFTAVLAITTFLYYRQTKWSNELAHKANKLTRASNDIDKTNFEMHITERLFDTENDVRVLETDLMKADNDKDLILRKFKHYAEMRANVYEDACQYYLEGKLNKERFKEMFGPMLKIHSKDEKLQYLYGQSSPFKATRRVLEKWTNE